MAKITAAPSPTTFSQAWSEEFDAAVTRAAGTDGRLTLAEVKKMAKKTDGDQFYADDARKYLEANQQKSVSVAKLRTWAPGYSLAEGARVSGRDGKISFADATKLPGSLVEDFFLLRGRALPTGPASEVAALEAALTEKTTGMTMPSETDAAFKFVSSSGLNGRPIDEATIRELLSAQHDAVFPDVMWVDPSEVALSGRTPAETVDTLDFLDGYSEPGDPNDPDSVAAAQKFAELASTLKANLTDLKVYRFGEINISVFIVGRTRTGELAGLLTGLVET